MNDNVISVLILAFVYLFVLPLFNMNWNKEFVKEYAGCVCAFAAIAGMLIGLTAVVSAVFWALETLSKG